MKNVPTNRNNSGVPNAPNATFGVASPVTTAPIAATSATAAGGSASVSHQITHRTISPTSAGDTAPCGSA